MIIQFGLPSVSIGFNQYYYPELVAVPGYPVYYAPGADSNFFFYDGLYWVYERDNWYASSWYNGPWSMVAPFDVPFFILRVPVQYYRHPPAYFRGWHRDAPPRWGDHWGHDWEQRRGGWDRWDRRRRPRPRRSPSTRGSTRGDRYPPPQQQQVLQSEHYRHAPGDEAVRKVYQEQSARRAAGSAASRTRQGSAARAGACQGSAARAAARQGGTAAQQPAREAPQRSSRQGGAACAAACQGGAACAAACQGGAASAGACQGSAARTAARQGSPHAQQPAKEAPRAQQPAKEAPRAQPARAPEQDRGSRRASRRQATGQGQEKDQGRDQG